MSTHIIGPDFCLDCWCDEVVERDGIRFEFSKRFGPIFLRADGEPLKNQPVPHRRSKHWRIFEEWAQEQAGMK